jgi:Flp pilus assembly protein protease CpaA
MIDFIIYLAIAGSFIAGLLDLKTTEVPDEIPFLMSGVGIFYWLLISLKTGDYSFIAASAGIGTLLLLFGLFLYKKGQWGGADALMLAAIAYMVPFNNGRIFMLDYVPNLFLAGSVYMIFYSIILGFTNKKTLYYLYKDLRGNIAIVVGAPLLFIATFFFLYAQLGVVFPNSISMAGLVFALVVLWRYAFVVEQKIFRKRIQTKHLKEGDVLESMIWRGLTHTEVLEIAKKKKYVIIKEGVRFVPAFPLALLITLWLGNLLLYFI